MDYITDSGGGEMDQTQNGEVVIGPQPDPNMSVQDAEMEEDEARSEATFRFTVHQFSKLKVSKTIIYLIKIIYFCLVSEILHLRVKISNHSLKV